MIKLWVRGKDEPWEMPRDFEFELRAAYYEVPEQMLKAQLWTLANPQRRPTVRGVKRFVVNWLSRSAKLKPVPESSNSVAFTTAWATNRTPESIEQGRLAMGRIKAIVKG